ncbi:hypothetical protein IFM89_008905 [Coptis chinensis]|uniref:RING-type domain-containing protein n=1 Tax=Coptis chinensis TaxID=261450 RepID=A0A835H467_9MAGN|nr:hypothetical protein IFM89_008905 [Coptis chinensis]
MGFSRFYSLGDAVATEGLFSAMSSGLARLIMVSEQSNNMSGVFCYKSEDRVAESTYSDNCVVCLCRLKDGEQVRSLACRHVFHKTCLDGWVFDHLNVTCPLCRSPLVSEERFKVAQRQVAGDLVTWFSMR